MRKLSKVHKEFSNSVSTTLQVKEESSEEEQLAVSLNSLKLMSRLATGVPSGNLHPLRGELGMLPKPRKGPASWTLTQVIDLGPT